MKASTQSIRQKIARIAAGGRPRVLDLFAGCGGLSLGFHAAGFQIAGAVEIDADAAASHALNFHGGAREQGKARDIATLAPEELVRELELGQLSGAIDVMVGGPAMPSLRPRRPLEAAGNRRSPACV